MPVVTAGRDATGVMPVPEHWSVRGSFETAADTPELPCGETFFLGTPVNGPGLWCTPMDFALGRGDLTATDFVLAPVHSSVMTCVSVPARREPADRVARDLVARANDQYER
jgi:hypothetical protein